MKAAALLFALFTLTTACGQKPGVSELPNGFQAFGSLPEGATVDPETGNILDEQGNVIGNVGPDGTGGPAGGAVDPDSVTGGADEDGDGPPPADSSISTTGDATGVTDTQITIGAHAPLTGAAPVPSDSAQKGVDLYWEWLSGQGKKIHGRSVESILKNDNYNPSQAVAVCKEMVEEDRVFLLYGFAGTDQIQACARYARAVSVPYLSVGVTETGLDTLPNYFAVSLSYVEQGVLLSDFLVTKLGARRERNGMLRFDTPNFQDAHDSFVASMDKASARVIYDRTVSRGAGQTEAQAVVQEMKAQDIENVYVLTSPVWFLQVLQAARTQNYTPQWVGVGISKAIDSVASVGCRNGTLNRAKFFSPYPAWADIDRYDPNFKKAIQAVFPEKGEGDDIMLIPWGMSQIIAELFERTGRDLSRPRFIAAVQRARNVKTEVFPPVSFSPTDHFGGSQVHVNEAQCSGYKAGDNRWHTIQPFVSNF